MLQQFANVLHHYLWLLHNGVVVCSAVWYKSILIDLQLPAFCCITCCHCCITLWLYYVRTPLSSQLLVDSGANVNVQDKDGRTPLHEAIQCHMMTQLKTLTGSGSDLSTVR